MPNACVATTIERAGITGRLLVTHFVGLGDSPSFSSVSSETFKVSTQRASTHSPRPPKSIAVLTRTALGRKVPIFMNVVVPTSR